MSRIDVLHDSFLSHRMSSRWECSGLVHLWDWASFCSGDVQLSSPHPLQSPLWDSCQTLLGASYFVLYVSSFPLVFLISVSVLRSKLFPWLYLSLCIEMTTFPI